MAYQKDAPYSCLMHFHEVHEFIVFEHVNGQYFNQLGETHIRDNDIVFTPALETHDFELNNEQKSWFIIQFLPELFQQTELQHLMPFFEKGVHLKASNDHALQVQQLTQWLLESYQQNPISYRSLTLLKLLVLTIADVYQPVVQQDALKIPMNDGLQRLAPVLNLFKDEQYIDISLEQAAKLCFLSPSYFSRMFKKVFRCNFSEYLVRHKLNIAARRLSQTQDSITDISYDLGFANPSHFIAQFKKTYDQTPLKYRKQMIDRTI
ncbi:helix-turn-helix transcriptional regulator [Thalassotalea agarivorans]|uniref:helix-turn-helix transcriptional regulator n=1 Tax=Thalassotalea agarivorans TaxID=349064 RepID=UPI001FDF0D91|nr:AraC family transcriptional regulator [Thalassotalea agarivorans]